MTLLSNVIIAFCLICAPVHSLNVVIAGGTGKVGQTLASRLGPEGHEVTILARNTFLASAPARVSGDYGWVGEVFLRNNPHVRLRDWDGGDLLDIVGKDWVGWQDDALPSADVVVNLVGGFTEQRSMAAERLIRESLRLNPGVPQITLSPIDDDIDLKIKKDRVAMCEQMVSDNCATSACIRAETNDIDGACKQILDIIKNMD